MSTDSYKTIRKTINSKFQGKNWDALITGLSSGDQKNYQNILALKDQIKIATATGSFLDTLLANKGVVRPPGIGISDDLFRQLGIKVTNNKIVTNIFLDVLDVFYGVDATHATVTSERYEEYQLSNGMTLELLVDSNTAPLIISFVSKDFTSIGRATAAEIASVITNQSFSSGYTLYAEVSKDQNTGYNYVKLYSSTRGPKSSITVIGGSAQNVLQFPNQRPTTQVGGTSPTEFTASNDNGFIRFTWTGGSDPGLINVNIGDYVNIYGSNILPENQGSFQIKKVTSAYFDIVNPNFQPQSPILLATVGGASGGGSASISKGILPGLSGLSRVSNLVTVNTILSHQLNIGNTVTIANTDNASFIGTFSIANILSPTSFTYFQNGLDLSSGGGEVISSFNIVNEPFGAVRSSINGLTQITTESSHNFITGQIIGINGVLDSSFNGNFTVTVTSANSFTYDQSHVVELAFYESLKSTIQRTSRYATVFEVNPYEIVIFLPATSAVVTRDLIGAWHLNPSIEQSLFPGSYIYDTKAPFSIKKESTRLAQQIDAGQVTNLLFAQDTTQFPDGDGLLVIDFGTATQEGPIKFFSRPSSSSLLIDASYKFKYTHNEGADVTLIYQKGPYKPDQYGADYQAYVTDSVQGTVQAKSMINSISASGIVVNIVIVYPGSEGLADVTQVFL